MVLEKRYQIKQTWLLMNIYVYASVEKWWSNMQHLGTPTWLETGTEIWLCGKSFFTFLWIVTFEKRWIFFSIKQVRWPIFQSGFQPGRRGDQSTRCLGFKARLSSVIYSSQALSIFIFKHGLDWRCPPEMQLLPLKIPAVFQVSAWLKFATFDLSKRFLARSS